MTGKINVYVVGSGGREAMLGRICRESGLFGDIFVGPGNGGTSEFGTPAIVTPDFPRCKRFISFLKEKSIGLVLSGSENDLVKDLGDIVRMHNIPFFGASSAAARFESSKIRATEFMHANNISHPDHEIFDNASFEKNRAEAVAYAKNQFNAGVAGLVIKADGLAGGKGVFLAHSYDQFVADIDRLKGFGEAGGKFLVEQMLKGVEVSVTAIVGDDGSYRLLPFSQDYKRVGEGDTGDNTGGMGAVTVDLHSGIVDKLGRKVIIPTIDGAERMGIPMRRCAVYFGIMFSGGEPYVLEYNMRFGDPETQAIGLKTKNLALLLLQCARGERWDKVELDNNHYAAIIHAARGYPGDYSKSEELPITGIQEARGLENVMVNIAGTKINDKKELVVKGSRNINVIGSGTTQALALEAARAGSGLIKSDGLFYRSDIGCNLGEIEALNAKYGGS